MSFIHSKFLHAPFCSLPGEPILLREIFHLHELCVGIGLSKKDNIIKYTVSSGAFTLRNFRNTLSPMYYNLLISCA